MLELNSLFDERFYLSQYSDVAAAVGQGAFSSGFNHFQTFGQSEKRNPSGLFTEDYYLAKNPDVAQAVASGGVRRGLDHFLQYGQSEGRASSVFFDQNFYLDLNPDVAEAVGKGGLTPIEHFAKFGQYEQRDPITEFFTDFYLEANPDVANAVTAKQLTPIGHFLNYGQYENREFDPNFNAWEYLEQYPDVAAASKLGLSAAKHYLQFGINEGRLPEFDGTITSFANAIDLGTLGAKSVSGSITPPTNSRELYKFNISTLNNFSLTLNGLQADIDVSLIQDKNGDGLIGQSEDSDEILEESYNEGTEAESINALLEPGTYFIEVNEFQGTTNYNLSVSATPFSPPADTAGNAISTARDLGAIGAEQTISEFVGDADKDDFYKINVPTSSKLNVSLDNLSADADLLVIQDSNNNGQVEESEYLDASESEGNDSEFITDLALEPGNYFLNVRQFDGETIYDLKLSATPVTIPTDNAGETLDKARDIGNLTGTQTFNDFVGQVDENDIYRFSTSTTTDFNLNLNGLTSDADVVLSSDANNNGVIESNEQFRVSANDGAAAEAISINGLPAGTYYASVDYLEGNTDYVLTMSATPSTADPIVIISTPVDTSVAQPPISIVDSANPTTIIRDATDSPNFIAAIESDSTTKQSSVKKPATEYLERKIGADDSLYSLVGDSKWKLAPGGKLTFSFVNETTAAFYPGATERGKITSFSKEEDKDKIRNLLKDVFAPVISIKFEELDESKGDIGAVRFLFVDVKAALGPGNDSTYAYANYPADGQTGGDVRLPNNKPLIWLFRTCCDKLF